MKTSERFYNYACDLSDNQNKAISEIIPLFCDHLNQLFFFGYDPSKLLTYNEYNEVIFMFYLFLSYAAENEGD